MTTPTNSSSAFPPPRHKRNNSTGSLPSIGMCSFGSFNFDGHDSFFRAGGGGGGGDGEDSIVSEFERMIGGRSNSSNGSTSGMTASTMAHLPLILPSPKHGESSGPLRRRLHAVDTLNLPPCTPGSTAAASNRSRYSASATTTASTARSSKASTPSTPSQIGEIIIGGGSGMGAASPAPSQITLSTIGTNGTPVSRSTMRDLLDTLNSLEGGGDDVSSFGGSIGQSTIASKFQSPTAAPRSSSAKSLHTVTSLSSSSSVPSSRPPRALNIPSRNNITSSSSSSQRDSTVGAPPSGIPRPVSASTTNAGSMPPIHQKRETRAHFTFGAGDVSGPRRVSRNKNGSKGFQIPTIVQEVESDTQVATRAPPQSALFDSSKKENVHASKLPPMKERSRPKTQGKQKQSGAFPRNENVVVPTKASAKSHSRIKSTKIYTTAKRSSNQQMAQKLPSLHSSLLPQTNQRQHPDAVLPGSRRNYVGGNAHTVGTLAEF